MHSMRGRGHIADVCSTSKEEAVLAVTSKVGGKDGSSGTTQALGLITEETGECEDAVGRIRDEELAWKKTRPEFAMVEHLVT